MKLNNNKFIVCLGLILMTSHHFATGAGPFANLGAAAVRGATQLYGGALLDHVINEGVASLKTVLDGKSSTGEDRESAAKKPENINVNGVMTGVVVDQHDIRLTQVALDQRAVRMAGVVVDQDNSNRQ